MSWFSIWLLGVIIFPICLGVVNRYAKIVRRSEFKTEDDIGGFIVGMVIATALWPLATAVILIIAVGMAFRKFFIPD